LLNNEEKKNAMMLFNALQFVEVEFQYGVSRVPSLEWNSSSSDNGRNMGSLSTRG